MTVTDYPDYATPQAHADRIYATRVPAAADKVILGSNAAGQAIGANNTPTLVNAAVTDQLSYEMVLGIQTAAGSITPLHIFILFHDSTTGLLSDAVTVDVFAGTSVAPHVVRGVGPMNGDQISVQILNGSNAVTVKWVAMQTSRQRSAHHWQTITPATNIPVFPGFTSASFDMSRGVICASNFNVNAGASQQFLLPLYTGSATWWSRSASTTPADSDYRISYSSAQAGFTDLIYLIGQGGSSFAPFGVPSLGLQTIALPRSQMVAQLTNHNATTAQSMTMHLVAQELVS